MYESLGYSVFRRVLGYYGGGVRDTEEDAFGRCDVALFMSILGILIERLFADMRKPCRRDKDSKLSIKGGGRHRLVTPEECFM